MRIRSQRRSETRKEVKKIKCLIRLTNTNPNLKMSVKLEVENSVQFTKCEMYILGTFLRQKSLSKNLEFDKRPRPINGRTEYKRVHFTVVENDTKSL